MGLPYVYESISGPHVRSSHDLRIPPFDFRTENRMRPIDTPEIRYAQALADFKRMKEREKEVDAEEAKTRGKNQLRTLQDIHANLTAEAAARATASAASDAALATQTNELRGAIRNVEQASRQHTGETRKLAQNIEMLPGAVADSKPINPSGKTAQTLRVQILGQGANSSQKVSDLDAWLALQPDYDEENLTIGSFKEFLRQYKSENSGASTSTPTKSPASGKKGKRGKKTP